MSIRRVIRHAGARDSPLRFDPIAEAQRQWDARWGPETTAAVRRGDLDMNVIDRLAEQGLIGRVPAEDDRRWVQAWIKPPVKSISANRSCRCARTRAAPRA